MRNLESRWRKLIRNFKNPNTIKYPKQWLGGGIGILCYVILKAIGGYGWHGGDVIGLILLGFLPGAALAGSVFNND